MSIVFPQTKLVGRLCIAVVACIFVAAEPPHLEFVEKLRTSGFADLAIEYLDHLERTGPPELRAYLPLERAKTYAELADQQEDEQKRDQVLAEARSTYERVLQAKPKSEIAADAHLELARVIVRQGRHRLTAARRAEDKSERKDGLAQARRILDEAVKALTAADTVLRDQIAGAEDEDLKARMLQRQLAAQYEAAVVGISRALTLSSTDPAVTKARNIEIDAARKKFERISESDPNNALSWQAYAWAGRCWMELENTIQAKRTFEAIEKESSRPAAAGAIRAARYYQLQLIDSDPQAKARANEIVRGCEEWLNRYGNHSRTPEGQGVQFILATTLISQAQAGVTPGKEKTSLPTVNPTARTLLTKAERYLKSLSQSDGDYSRKANNLRSEILFLLMADRVTVGVDRLLTFEECHLTAQVESYRWSKAANDEVRRNHLATAIAALERGLRLTTKSDSPKEIFDARVMLCYLYLLANDPYSAAVMSEHLARSLAPAPRGAKAAVYGLSAYATILAQSKARLAPPDELAADEKRLRELAQFMEKHWAQEPDTDAARFQLGTLYYDAQDFASAVDMYAKVKPAFPAFAFAKLREGAAAQIAQSKEIPLPKEKKKQLLSIALADLEKVADPAPGFSMETILAHFQARLQLATLLLMETQREENYQRVEQIGRQLQKLLPSLMNRDDPLFPQLEAEAERVRTAGTTGQAYLQLKSENYAAARQTLQPLLASIAKSADSWRIAPHAESAWFQAFVQSQREVLLLNLKVDLLEGKRDDAQTTLGALRKLTTESQTEALFNSLLRVVYELKIELEHFRQAKQIDQQKKLEGGLINLIDNLALTKGLSTEARLVLAQAFGAVERHDKAAELLVAVPSPKADDESGQKTFRFIRLSLARELRQAKKFSEAKAILREILGTPAKKGWGFDNFDVRKEAIHLLEDEGDFANAVKMAADMQKLLIEPARQYVALNQQLQKAQQSPAKSSDANDKIDQQLQQLTSQRERFFEFYFLEIRAIVKNAHKADAIKAGESLTRVASRLVKLEQGQPDWGGDASRERFRELLTAEPLLKEKYEAAGGKVLIAPATP